MRNIINSVMRLINIATLDPEEVMTNLMLRGMATDIAVYRFLDTGEEDDNIDIDISTM